MLIDMFGHRLYVTPGGVSCSGCGLRWYAVRWYAVREPTGGVWTYAPKDAALRALRPWPLGASCEDVRLLILAAEVMET